MQEPGDEGRTGPSARAIGGLAIVVAVAGLVLRWRVLGSVLGAPDLDEATVGLQAAAFRRGELAPFFATQQYGGTAETALVALVTGIGGHGPLALKVPAVLLHLVAAVLTWRAALRLCGDRWAALLAPGLLWVGSAAVVWQSTKERGFYGVAVVLAAAALLLVVRLADSVTTGDVALLGAVAGLGVWSTPLLASAILPPALWLVAVRPAVLRRAWAAAAAALVGAAPWLAWNARHGWASLESPPSFHSTFAGRLSDFVDRLPVAVGLDTPWPGRPLVPAWLVVAGLAVLLAVATVQTRRRAPGLLVVCVAGYAVLQALNGLAVAVGPDPRYLYPLVPVLALVPAAAVTGLPPRARGPVVGLALAGAALTAAWGLAAMADAATEPRPDQFLASTGLTDVIDLLEASGRTTVMTDASGNQLAYLSGGQIRAASYAVPRFDELEEAGWRRGLRTYVLRTGYLGGDDARLAAYLDARAIAYERRRIGDYTVLLLERPVAPDAVPLTVFGGRFADPGG